MAMPPGLAAYMANKGGGGHDALKKEVADKGNPFAKKKKGGKKITDKSKAEAIARRLNSKKG